MFRIPRVSISMRELDRLKCIQGLIDKQLKQKAVAERLGLTVRQVRRLVERYELEGPRGLISKLRDRPGNRRLKPERAEEAFAVIRAQYADFGPTLAAVTDWVLIRLDCCFHVSSRNSSSGSSSMSRATANALRSSFSFANDSTPI
jgi:hypothetical protein